MTSKRGRNRNIRFTDDRKSQKLNFSKRKSTLKKKARELETLCDVMVCMVCFGPDGEVITWPENEAEVRQALDKYKEIGVNVRKRQSLFGFLESKKKKLEVKLGMMESKESGRRELGRSKGNAGNLFSSWDEKLDQFSEEALMGLCNSLEYKLQNLREKIRVIQTTRGDENHNAVVNGHFNQQSQALRWMKGECSVPPQTMFGDELVLAVPGMFADEPVLAVPGMSEAWHEEYGTNIRSNNNNWLSLSMMFSDQQVLAAPVNNEAWSKECNADVESINNYNNNCLSLSTMFGDQPVPAAAPVNSEAWSNNIINNIKNNSYSNLREKIRVIQTTRGDENQNAVVNDHFNQQSQALRWMKGECSVPPQTMFGDELVLAVPGMFADKPVLAAPGMSEAWLEEYCTNIRSNDNNWLSFSMMLSDQQVLAASVNNEAWSKECSAYVESSINNYNNNCLSLSTMFGDQPVPVAAPVNSEAWSNNNINNIKNNSNSNLFPDPDWFWGTSELCFSD